MIALSSGMTMTGNCRTKFGILTLAITLINALPGCLVGAGGKVGTSAMTFITQPAGARQAALGNAGASYTGGALAVHYNPANLTEVHRYEVSFQHTQLVESISQEHVAIAIPKRQNWGIGFSVDYLNSGSIDRTLADASGNFAGTAGTFKNNDLALTVAAGYRVSNRLSAGAALIYMKESLDGVSAGGFALDLGLTWYQSRNLTLAANVKNLGRKVKFIAESDPLPLTLSVSADYKLYDTLMGTIEVRQPRDNDAGIRGGIEYKPMERIALRAGYASENDADNGFTAGVGFQYNGMDLDYAYVPYGDLGNTHRVSISFGFGEQRVAKVRFAPKREEEEVELVAEVSPIENIEVEVHAAPSEESLPAWLEPGDGDSIADLYIKMKNLQSRLASMENEE